MTTICRVAFRQREVLSGILLEMLLEIACRSVGLDNRHILMILKIHLAALTACTDAVICFKALWHPNNGNFSLPVPSET